MNIYMIRDSNTGLFLTTGYRDRWHKTKGRKWTTLAFLRATLLRRVLSEIPDSWEIVEFEFIERRSRNAQIEVREFLKKKNG